MLPLLRTLLPILMSTALAAQATQGPVESIPDVVLITLDTTRGDHLTPEITPFLWSLAESGQRWTRAWSPSPLTLPAHTSLLTGRLPPEHGLRDNGTGALNPKVPLLSEALRELGYRTAAVIGSLVLDRRFGLARGFDFYDDRVDARQLGQFGDAERTAAQVTDAAVDWWQTDLTRHGTNTPRFLWVHYYDAHAPYSPPRSAEGIACTTPRSCYAAEIQSVDRQIRRLIRGLGQRPRIIAIVGDHGEALGEHGETDHGIFLYGATLEVPMILVGPGLAPRRSSEPVSTHTLATRLLDRIPGAARVTPMFDRALEDPLYAEALMPLNTYGWKPLHAVTTRQGRLVARPDQLAQTRPSADDLELLSLGDEPLRDLDPEPLLLQLRNVLARRQPVADAEARELETLRSRLASLGYLSAASTRQEHDDIDPLEGPAILAEVDRARRALQGRNATLRAEEVVRRLRPLARRNPGNLPLLSQLLRAQTLTGDAAGAVRTAEVARQLAPDLHFVHQRAAALYESLDREQEALQAWRRVLELNPRSYEATLALAQRAARAGDVTLEADLLRRALEAGLVSAALTRRLSELQERDPATPRPDP